MKKLLVSIIAVIAAVATVQAGSAKCIKEPAPKAMGSAYVAAYGGLNAYQTGFGDVSHKMGFDFGVKLGYDFAKLDCCGLIPALEVEEIFNHLHRGDGADKVKTYSWSTMLNALARADYGDWQPYGGFGVGWYYFHAKNGGSISKNGFAWQLIAGVDYVLSANWSIFAEYKWLNFQIRKHREEGLPSRIGQQIVNLGVRYRF